MINKNKWDKLPPDVQKIFSDVSKEWVEKHAIGWNEIDLEGKQYFLSLKGKVITLPPEEGKLWKEASRPVIQTWIKDKVKEGFATGDATKMIEYIESRIRYWEKKQSEMGVKAVTGS